MFLSVTSILERLVNLLVNLIKRLVKFYFNFGVIDSNYVALIS